MGNHAIERFGDALPSYWGAQAEIVPREARGFPLATDHGRDYLGQVRFLVARRCLAAAPAIKQAKDQRSF
jgi:hypothetical protein